MHRLPTVAVTAADPLSWQVVIAVGALAGLVAAVVMDWPMSRQPDGFTPAAIAAAVVSRQSVEAVSFPEPVGRPPRRWPACRCSLRGRRAWTFLGTPRTPRYRRPQSCRPPTGGGPRRRLYIRVFCPLCPAAGRWEELRGTGDRDSGPVAPVVAGIRPYAGVGGAARGTLAGWLSGISCRFRRSFPRFSLRSPRSVLRVSPRLSPRPRRFGAAGRPGR